MSDKNEIFGNYMEMNPGQEHMTLQFRAALMNIDELWESGALSASFLSNFWGKFFPSKDQEGRTEMKDAVRYIAGELIGNAVKFSYEPDFLIRIALCLSDEELHFYVTNSVRNEDAGDFKNFIRKILDNDPDELYIEQMEKNASEESDESRMGFLTMILDYGAEPAWEFKTDEDMGIQTVTTMLRLSVVRNTRS
ncbi:hypothetical protein QUF80_22235 [Desulfococcaceae bacterium HSG8]|nr:hypothetical protein [Desulfococcaceae bacterium HSG8]